MKKGDLNRRIGIKSVQSVQNRIVIMTRTVGLEEGRKQLPKLAELAHGGQGSLLTRHGKPYAAIVAPDVLMKPRRKPSFLALRGAGKGMWGKRSSDLVAELRDEWR